MQKSKNILNRKSQNKVLIDLGTEIRKKRSELGYSIERLASVIGTRTEYIAAIESGNVASIFNDVSVCDLVLDIANVIDYDKEKLMNALVHDLHYNKYLLHRDKYGIGFQPILSHIRNSDSIKIAIITIIGFYFFILLIDLCDFKSHPKNIKQLATDINSQL